MKTKLMTNFAMIVALALAGAAPAATIDWVTVGDPGNVDDETGYGAVGYVYWIGKYEVTNAQYSEFLNAVGATDTNELYDTRMLSGHNAISRSGSVGNFSYSAIDGQENVPVAFVSFYDALRFANWLHNDQPSGPQGNATTEDGAYTITQEGIDNGTILRNPGATVFLASEDEWYKAAYFNGSVYFDHPSGSDTALGCAAPGPAPNTGNCGQAVGSPTPVGSYTGSASPYGTYDQGGNVWEWLEERSLYGMGYRRGASYVGAYTDVGQRFTAPPNFGVGDHGFRVATNVIPEPGALILALVGLALLPLRRHSLRRYSS